MSSVKNEEIPEVFNFMRDFWTIVKQFWNPERNETYDQQTIDALRKLGHDYPHRFCHLLILAYFDYLEEKEYGTKYEMFEHRKNYMFARCDVQEAEFWQEQAECEKNRPTPEEVRRYESVSNR